MSRIAAIAGDRIAFRGGVPIVNGITVPQSSRGTVIVQDVDGPNRAILLTERLPSAPSTHLLLDLGASALDDIPEVVVPRGHFMSSATIVTARQTAACLRASWASEWCR